ncbi:molecular chaperone DnaK [Bradymonadaceae bacterium TMQ3]|uniref:Molecular chaperone DnaK n=1 Tax=Lujinxingia sediminis TaxID=2480984 RepID=A0ABY0CPF6_9DELT|nr:molecular chaperone DnaK [Lujinxingia sediminis]RDV37991.1 molecular chaperone DnaK [Bradymonadaceae bacterium TMQ3]RVU42339.1 molecular chaperone DnaK [Lujinxingia sediminis]TXC75662.1 molecular chaperone DnaK [Bradymonadales bacterium TMQ1]
MGKIIGIDLGTTNSCVAVIDGGEPLVLPNSEGSRTTPSMVGFTEDNEQFVGQQAKRQAIINPERTIYDIKRLLGHKNNSPMVKRYARTLPYSIVENTNGDAWVEVNGQAYSPQEISSMILRKMKQTAEDYFGEEITEAVITVPAYFNDAQRSATKDAGKIAGLTVRRIINEPTAAALAYGFARSDDANIVVFDLGGGTFDVSVVQLRGGVFEVVSTSGDNHLGGEDFDRAVLEFLMQRFEDETGIDVSEDNMALQRLKEAAENAKCELSTLSETNINLPFLAVDESGPRHLSLSLSRSQLNDLCYDLVERLESPCMTALKDGGVDRNEIDDILLVGGMTRMPLVQEKVEEIFGKKPNKGVNPDEVVATGAAIQSGILGGEVREVILLDITPFSLGIRVTGDRFSPIIQKNTPIPTMETKVFTTTEANQDMVTVTVLQGEHQVASRNKLLGMFNLTGINPAAAGSPRIEVTFEIDTDGIVNVSARDLRTNVSQSITVEGHSGLSDEELQRAIQRSKKR